MARGPLFIPLGTADNELHYDQDGTTMHLDTDDGLVKFKATKSTEIAEVVATDSNTLTFTNKTLTSPVLTTPTFSSATLGHVFVAGGTITELTGDATYNISVTLPAGSILLDIIITAKANWNSATSATLIVGDTADPDGFFTAVNAKTTPAVGTSLRPDTVPGGTVDGVYLGDTNGEFVGPTTSNFGRFYEAGSTITATVTKVGAGTAGRTQFTVVYAIPTVVAQVVT